MTTQYGMLIDTTRCMGCQTCVVSCKLSNAVPGDIYWGRVVSPDGDRVYRPSGTFPNVKLAFRPELCNHCGSPACVAECPTGAMHKRDEDGVVLSDPDVCIGCGTCVQACPYGAPVLDENAKRAIKCDLCRPRIERGEEPLCVCSCPAEARMYGDISDSTTDIAKAIAGKNAKVLLPEEGTEPSVYYC